MHVKSKKSPRIFVVMWLLILPLDSCNAFVSRLSPVWKLQQSQGQVDVAVPVTSKCFMVAHTSTSSKGSSPKYPVQRGQELDSRKIVVSGRQHLTAIRLNHILFCSQELATQTLYELKSATLAFDQLARQISNCAFTRDEGGSIGWVSTQRTNTKSTLQLPQQVEKEEDDDDDESTQDSHLDPILPPQARKNVLNMHTKPGDIVLVQSERGYHLVQIADVMVDVRQMAMTRPRNKIGVASDGILGGALTRIQDKNPNGKIHDNPNNETSNNNNNNTPDLTYIMETMGCQMNQADSERMEGQLQALGIRPLGQNETHRQPNLVVLNTCSIRDHAEQKVYSRLGPHAKRKREGDDVVIVVAGCVAQQQGEALLRKAPEVDLVMGPQYANRLADLLEDVSNGNQVVATDAAHIMEDSTKPRRSSSVAAWVNVIYGCNERCTFCIVPTTRGVEQSRPVETIVAEITQLVDQGYKEITLLGQNIDAYGRDMVPKRRFSDLIRTAGAVPGLNRLRFVTSHPRYMSLGVVDAVAETPAACHAFHVPFQSGSNRILEAMGRGHTREKYLAIVERIRSRLPEASITADVIVGFPGETEEDFQDTLDLMMLVKFDSVNTAAYSPRPNTPAAVWTNQVDDAVKQERLVRINALNKLHAAERRHRLLGQIVEILVEERNVKVPTQVMGRTTQGYICYCDGDIDELRGKMVQVRVDACQTYYLVGRIVASFLGSPTP